MATKRFVTEEGVVLGTAQVPEDYEIEAAYEALWRSEMVPQYYAMKATRSDHRIFMAAYSKELFMKNMSLKVNDLAELSGFHTITTYTMAFKVVMDESPSAWCRRMRVKSLR